MVDGAKPLAAYPRLVRFAGESERGSWEAFSPARGVAVLRIEGHMVRSDAVSFFGALDRIIGKQHGIDMFDDFELFTRYDPGVREVYAEWNVERGPQIGISHVLVRSKIVAMGLSVVNIAQRRRMDTYANRARFEAALSAAVARHDPR